MRLAYVYYVPRKSGIILLLMLLREAISASSYRVTKKDSYLWLTEGLENRDKR